MQDIINFILDIELNNGTLMVFFLLPFSYFFYTSNLFDGGKKTLCNLINISLSSVLILYSFFRIYDCARLSKYEGISILILHIAVGFLSILIIFKNKVNETDALVDSFFSKQAILEGQKSSGYTPEAVSKESIGEYTWDDIIISDDLKAELNSVINLLKDPQNAKLYGIDVPKGILFNGPPGTGKTTIARVVANLSGLSFYVLSMNEIVSKWVGESEKNLTKLFETAGDNAPAIIFIDEIDSIGKQRSSSNADHADKLLNQLLQLIDGVIKREGIYIIAATNRADLVDSALKRAGRLNRTIEIGLPDMNARNLLFAHYTKKLNLGYNVNLEELARRTENCSAADIKSICDQAGLYSYKREENLPKSERTYQVSREDLETALVEFTKDKDGEVENFEGEKKKNQAFLPQNASIEKIGWDDIVVNDDLKAELNSVINLLKDPENAKLYGIDVPKGILFNGPPGTGKTTLAKVVANTANMAFFVLQANDIVSKWVGDSEKNLTALFKAAQKYAPSIIFIDEIDSIGKQRSSSNAEHSDKLLNQLLQLIDGVIKSERIYIIGATNRADLVDSALKRAGRLNRTIEIGLPDKHARNLLFVHYTKKLKMDFDVDFDDYARRTENCCAADIKAICDQAGLYSYKREEALPKEERTYLVTREDIEQALLEFTKDKDVDAENYEGEKKKNTALLPQNDSIEKIGWDDIIISKDLKAELNSVIKLLKGADNAKKFGIEVPKGMLLYGPPGTGKTTIAKVMANTANMAFFVLQTSDIVSKWVGDSEKNLTALFKAAQKYAPSILFIDEIDSIAKNRNEQNAQHSDNLLNHLLQLIDGVIKREGIYIIGATNRPDLVDPALKRGGRLTKSIYIPLPDFEARKALLKLYFKKYVLQDNLNYDAFANRIKGKSGADIKAICTQAGLNSFKRNSALGIEDFSISKQDIKDALDELCPIEKK